MSDPRFDEIADLLDAINEDALKRGENVQYFLGEEQLVESLESVGPRYRDFDTTYEATLAREVDEEDEDEQEQFGRLVCKMLKLDYANENISIDWRDPLTMWIHFFAKDQAS